MTAYHVFFTMVMIIAGGFHSVTAAENSPDVKVIESQFDQPLPATTKSQQSLPHNATSKRSLSSFSAKGKFALSHQDEPDYWVFDAWSELYNDDDYDGYYSSLRLSVDVDSVYAQAPVYLVIYLGDETEYNSVHVSSVFTVYGDDSNDYLVMDIALVTGFRPYDYDVLVEVYDASTDALLTYSDALDDADLSYLSLESADYDREQGETVVVVEEHGGSTGVFSLLALSALAVVRIRKRIKKAAKPIKFIGRERHSMPQ